jgi:arabinogalactan oligomer/maltooligosaccharide transport system permease protein
VKTKLLGFLLVLFNCFAFVDLSVQAEDTVLRVWVGAIEGEKLVMEEIAEDFTKETGVKVEVYQKLEIFTVPSALVNNAELDERPDIVYMQAPDIGGLVKSGYLEELDLGEDVINRFLDVAFSAFTYNNKLYGVGYNNSASGLIYNKDLISEEKLPDTWDELFRLADEITTWDEKGEPLIRGLYLNATDMWFNYPLIKECGGYYYGKYPNGTYNAYDIGLNNEGMLEYVTLMKELMAKGYVLNNPNKKDYSDIIASFIDGKVGMFFYGLWSAESFKKAGINYGIAPLPVGKNGERSQPITTVEGFVINKFSLNKDLAKRFLEYILQDESQQLLIEAGNRYDKKTGERNPTNRAVIASDYIQSDPILRQFAQIGEWVEPFPNIPEGPLWYNQDLSINAFKAIFFGDRHGNPVDPQYKLNEFVQILSQQVALMNEVPEHINLPWWAFVVLGIIVVSVIMIYTFQKTKKQRKLKFKVRYDKKTTLLAWALLLPIMALLLMFYVFPIFHNFYLSLTDYSGINLRDYGLIGLGNYQRVLTIGINGLLSMSLWTVIFAFSVVAISFVFGTILAVVLDSTHAKIAKIYRIIYILPWVIPTVITLLMWQGLLETQGGLINQILGAFGIPGVPWLTNPLMAKISTILVMVWFSFPYFMVIAFGYLKSIPKDYYEAAVIDGANKKYIFLKIILPLLFRALLPMLIMSFIMQFNQFGVYMLTQGGPASDILGNPGATDLLITYVFNTAFNTKRYAIAATYSVIIFVFVAVFALTMMRINQKRLS